MPAARGGGGSGGGGGCGLWWLRLDVDGLVVGCWRTVVDDGGEGGSGCGLLRGLCLVCPWRWNGPHHIIEQGGVGGDGGSGG